MATLSNVAYATASSDYIAKTIIVRLAGLSSNMTILTLLLEKKICSKEEYVSTFNEIQSKNMENINQIKNKIHEIEEQIKQYEQQMRKKG